ncbi:MAG: S-layer homology domain-containing protein [Eubacteriales bacterium]|nr:S-layer homology domain-containing protein [Eubacteriales bacterium]
MKGRKSLSAILILAMVLTFAIPVSAFGATSFSDARGHWAESYINKAVSKGIVTGYPDGKFRPDAPVTRAEFITMVNKALGNRGSASVNFSDTPAFEWYYQAVAKAVAAAYTGGYDDGTFRPDAKISRQEAAVMISRIVPTYGYSASIGKFKDSAKVASWAASSLSKVNGKGYIGAYDDGLLHPEDSLTRAQTAKIITDIIDKENIVTTATTISKDGTTLSGKIYSNGVTVSKNLDDGEATISNCVVIGTLSVQGGGEETVTVQNSRVANATVSRSDDPVRLLLKGETTVNTLNAERTATIETSSLAGGDFGEGAKVINLQGSSKITLIGNFPKVNIDGRTAELILDSGTITDLDVTASGRDAGITVESRATVTKATVNAQASFRGEGTIRTMDVEANNVTYEKKPGSLNVGRGVTIKPELVAATAGKFDPKDGETGVKDSVNPTITFNSRTETRKGDRIDSEYLENNIVFKRNSSKGADVPFSARINSANTIITITPEEDLVDGKYYLGFAKSAFRSYDTEEALIASYVTWTVGNVSEDVTFKPDNGEKNVSKSIKPTLTFNEAIETYGGKEILKSRLDDMIDDDDLYLYKGTSKSNRLDSSDASINSAKKVITISPGELSEGEYTLGFKASTFRTEADGKRISASSVKFTVGNPAPTVSFSPANGATNIGLNSSISITFSERMYNSSGKSDSASLDQTYLDGAISVKDGSTTLTTGKSFGSGYTRVTIYPPTGGWVQGKTYTVNVNANKFRNSSGAYVVQSTSTFKTVQITALNFSYPTPSSLTVGTFASLTPNISGGTSPYTYKITGTLPIGLSFNTSTGGIAGTPSTAELGKLVTITVTDSTKPTALTKTITINFPPVNAAGIHILIPKGNVGLKYTGSELTGVELATGYALGGVFKATNAGSYTATANLQSGYKWIDGSTAEKTINWSIAKADGPVAPNGLAGTAPTTYGGSDGKITGTTANMEYKKDTDGTYKTCAKGETGAISAGTYYVRVKVTDKENINLGKDTTVTISEGSTDPTDPKDPIDPTDPKDPIDPTDPKDPKDPTNPEGGEGTTEGTGGSEGTGEGGGTSSPGSSDGETPIGNI